MVITEQEFTLDQVWKDRDLILIISSYVKLEGGARGFVRYKHTIYYNFFPRKIEPSREIDFKESYKVHLLVSWQISRSIHSRWIESLAGEFFLFIYYEYGENTSAERARDSGPAIYCKYRRQRCQTTRLETRIIGCTSLRWINYILGWKSKNGLITTISPSSSKSSFIPTNGYFLAFNLLK